MLNRYVRANALQQELLRHNHGGMTYGDWSGIPAPSYYPTPDSRQVAKQIFLFEDITDKGECGLAQHDRRQGETIRPFNDGSKTSGLQQMRAAISCDATSADQNVRHGVIIGPPITVM